MENGAKNNIQQALALLTSQEDPQFILAFESNEDRVHVLANGKSENLLAMCLNIAEGLHEEVGCDSTSDLLFKLMMAARLSELEEESAN